MRLYQRRPGGVWYYDLDAGLSPGGRRARGSTGTRDHAQAAEYAAKVAADAWRQSRLGERARLTWEQAALRYLEERAHLRDLDNVKTKLRWLTQHLAGVPIDSIDATRIRALAVIKSAEGVTGATVNRQLATLSAVLHAARKRGELESVPHVAWRPEAAHRDVEVTPAQLQRLIDELPPHLRALARFSLATGLRDANARMLEWSRIDLGRAVAWFPGTIMKNGKPLAIPLSAAALAVLSEQQGLHERWVFPYRGAPVTKATNTAWCRARERAGLAHLRWHDLRHVWAIAHVVAGTPDQVLQQLGAWKDARMLARYAVLNVEHTRQWAEVDVPGLGTHLAQPADGAVTDGPAMRGVTDGIRTHNNWNHNPGLYR